MSSESQIVVKRLKSQIEQIISKYESALSEKAILNDQLTACKVELETHKTKIKELEIKIDQLQLTNAFKASSEDVKDAKQKIGRLVKEIDKCISMLND